MDRHPALLDPRSSPTPPEGGRAGRTIPWTFVWLGVIGLLIAGGVAWVALNPGKSLFGTGTQGPTNGDKVSADKAVAVAYVDTEKGITMLYSVRPGRVVAVYVNEGDEVTKDKPLVKVDDSIAREQQAEAEQALEGARVRKKQAEQLALQHQDAIRAQEQKIVAVRTQVGVAEATVAKAKRYYVDRLGGTLEDVRIAEESVKQARAAVEAESAQLDAIKNANPHIAVEAADVEIKAKQAQLNKAKLDLDNYVLLSPGKGKILRSFVNVGEALGSNPQRPALEFAPDGELIVRAEIEQEFAGRVKKGMKAKIQDYDFSSEAVWGGEVVRLSDWITKRRSQVFEPMQFNDVRTLEAVIKVKGEQKYPLRIGQRVRVTLEW